MSIAEKLETIAANEQRVYEAGKQAERERFWKGFFQTGQKSGLFCYLFAGAHWDADTFDPIFPDEPLKPQGYTGAEAMFTYFNRNGAEMYDLSEACRHIDFSEALRGNNTFASAKVKNITCDFSNAETLASCFGLGNGGPIDNITLTVTAKCTNYSGTFAYNVHLTTLTFTEGSVIAGNIDFGSAAKLSAASRQSIINALQDRTGMPSLKVTFHSTVKANLTDEQYTQIVAKNWSLG